MLAESRIMMLRAQQNEFHSHPENTKNTKSKKPRPTRPANAPGHASPKAVRDRLRALRVFVVKKYEIPIDSTQFRNIPLLCTAVGT